MIVDEHEGPAREPRVDAAGRVGQDDPGHAQPSHDAHGEGNPCQRTAFIHVDATGEGYHSAPADEPADEPAGMPDDARGRPVWYLAVAHLECLGQTVGEVTEARPQDNRHLGSAETTSAQELRGLDRFVELGQRASHRITESLTPRRR